MDRAKIFIYRRPRPKETVAAPENIYKGIQKTYIGNKKFLKHTYYCLVFLISFFYLFDNETIQKTNV